MDKVLISVIMPTYGDTRFLDKAIFSVLNQTIKEIELIIVDDNAPDSKWRQSTENIVNKFCANDKRIVYLKHNANLNGATARNTGIRVAKGEVMSFLDSDDEYMPDRLKKCYNILSSLSSDFAGVYTGCEFRRSGKTFNIITNINTGSFLTKTLACRFNFCTGSNLFVRADVVRELNGFDESFFRHQDYEFLVRFFLKYKLFALPEVLVIKNNENFNLPLVQKSIAIKEQYLLKFKSVIQTMPETDQFYIYQSNFIAIAEQALKSKENGLSKEYYQKASLIQPLSFKTKLRRIVFTIKNLL